MWRLSPTILALRMLGQEECHEFKASLGYVMNYRPDVEKNEGREGRKEREKRKKEREGETDRQTSIWLQEARNLTGF